MAALPSREAEGAPRVAPTPVAVEAGARPRKAKTKKRSPNAPTFDLAAELRRAIGVDWLTIEGIHVMTAQTILAELGPDRSAFPTQSNFTSGLGLLPWRDISGGKVMAQRCRRVKHRVANALRLAAEALAHSDSYLGARYRHLRGQLGELKAVKAMARYLACLVYRLLTKGQAWVDRGSAEYEPKRKERELVALQRKATKMGMRLVAA